MKWFKHMSDARNGNSMARLVAEFGLHRAYACYFLLTEFCAEKWDGISEPVFETNLRHLQFILGMKSKLLENYLRTTSELEFWSVERIGDVFIIKFPKLAEIRDNHTKNLQVTGKKVAEKLPLDLDKEEDIDNKEEAPSEPPKKSSSSQLKTKTKKAPDPKLAFEKSDDLLAAIPSKSWETWSKAFPGYPKEEILAAVHAAWLWNTMKAKGDKGRTLQGWSSFLTNWLIKAHREWKQREAKNVYDGPGSGRFKGSL